MNTHINLNLTTSAQRIKFAFSLLILGTLTSCSPIRTYDMSIPETLVDGKYGSEKNITKDSTESTEAQNSPSKETKTRFSNLPSQPAKTLVTSALQLENKIPLTGKPSKLNIEGLPLPEFINEVYGNLLGLSFHLDPQISNLKDLVTLRIDSPLPPEELYQAGANVLESYGISIKADGELLQFNYSPTGARTEPPLIVSGNALPNVPTTHRPVFYLMNLNVVEAQQAVSWLSQAFEGQKATFRSDPARNAVWLQGTLEVVKQAAEVVKLVDQPLMRGRNSIRIEPRYLGADKLAQRLVEMLKAQGYNATVGQNGTVNFFVIEETNSIITFAADPNILSFVKSWVEELDKPLKQTKGESAFYYEVQRTSATSIAETINQLRTGPSISATAESNGAKDTGAAPRNNQLVVDPARNALLFYGTNNEWMSLLPTIEQLDKEALQVLIEVIIAEVSLSDSLDYGVSWAANNLSSGLFGADLAKTVSFSTGKDGSGLQYFPINSSGSARAVLNLLNSDSKVKILQTPRILVRSGEEANINVGTDIPIQASTITNPDAGGAVTQLNQYRKTGNSLSVTPVVFAGGQVDLSLNQELSTNLNTDNSLTPSIFSRSISTALTIQDGGSILVGGLINTTESDGGTKIPYLNKIPVIGKILFTSSKRATERTELIILITPYVIKNNKDAEAVTKAFRSSMSIEKPADTKE